MLDKNEYVGPYRWDEARERTVNDYKDPDFVPTQNDGFRDENEEADYYEKLMDCENDIIF